MRNLNKILFFPLLAISSLACGSSGGDGTIDPSQVEIKVTPDVLDSGERTRIRLKLFNFTTPKVTVKIRYPSGLDFVADSAAYLVDNQDVETTPDVEEVGDSQDYLVFFVDTEELGDPNNLELIFQLRATEDVAPNVVEVDIDLDDPDISNSEEFVIATPQFDVQESAYIQVGAVTTTTTS